MTSADTPQTQLSEAASSAAAPSDSGLRSADFDYHLPARLIAQRPPERRGDSRLLVLDGASGERRDAGFAELLDLLDPRDLLVFNDTRVIPARLRGRKASGGRVEVLVERITGAREALCHVRASKSPKAGARLWLEGAVEAEVSGREGALFRLRFAGDEALLALLERHGHMPLPPYIQRADDDADLDRYQTVYARAPGAVAAPTAGLHFDEAMLAELDARGIGRAFVTLHVGAGTFQPVRVEDIANHRMHAEWLQVDAATCAAVAATRARGGRVVAVGTTVVRALESAAAAAADGELRPYLGDTRLFITPGARFAVIDALLTNFHLPQSTLLMLVSAFAGRERVLDAYRHAVAAEYRFFSYGDAMFLLPDRSLWGRR